MRSPLSALEAFSKDAETVSDSSRDGSASLGAWLAITKAAEQLSSLPASRRSTYLASIATQLLPPTTARPTLVHDALDAPTDANALIAERLRLEAESMERAGCFEMAFTTLSAVCRLSAGGEVVPRMLAIAHLGRIARQLDDLPTAQECYDSVIAEALRKRDPPLEALGLLGLGAIARMAGNRPDERRFYGLALSRSYPGGITERSAHQGLMNAAISEKRLADALLHGWRSFDLAREGSEERAMVLGNLALTALTAGFPGEALRGFLHVLTLTPVLRIRMPAYGGALRAAARMGDRARLMELEASALDETKRSRAPFEVCGFFLSAAESWAAIPDLAMATSRLDHLDVLLRSHRFNELAMKADVLRDALRTAVTQRDFEATMSDEVWTEERDDRAITGIRRLAGLP